MRWIELETDGWEAACAALRRPLPELDDDLLRTVAEIAQRVRRDGDLALLELGRRFDAPGLNSLKVDPEEWEAGIAAVEETLRRALERAACAIRSFHEAQLRTSWMCFADHGLVGQIIRPLAHVGVYVPGGRAVYPSSVLMCGVPASVAGVEEVVLCTPASRDGTVHPTVLYAAKLAGVRAIYKVGGAQAVAAMAYGTETIPRVDKIVGPGNVYVCAAKRLLWGVADMDMIAGPSEVCVVADEKANPVLVAADMLTQAEHDPDCAAYLLTPSKELASRVREEIGVQLQSMSRGPIAAEALEKQGVCIVTRNLDEAVRLANECAPEHLALHVEEPMAWLGKVRNAGAVMLGAYTPQTAGDYLAGPSHTLPTSGTARFWSPLNVDTFLKKTSLVAMTREQLSAVAADLELLAEVEGFQGHARAVQVRMDDGAGDTAPFTEGQE